MLSALFYGSSSEGPPVPDVPEGHRGIDVVIDGQSVFVDVGALAAFSGLFLQVHAIQEHACHLEEFPGGIGVFCQIVGLLVEPEKGDSVPLQVTEDNVLNLFEAAWLLECPRIFDEVMDSVYMRSLSSRRRVDLLEHLLPFTAASSPAETTCALQERMMDEEGGDVTAMAIEDGASAAMEEFMRIFLLETMMWQCTERAALELASQLDTGDFVLGPRLATGSLRMCCELLRLHQQRKSETGIVGSTFQPVSNMWKNLTDKPLRAKVSWDAHLFALHCMRKRLPHDPATKAARGLMSEDVPGMPGMAGEHEEDEEAKGDIPDELCVSVDDRVLRSFSELVRYVSLSRTQPNWTALLIRTLLLSGKADEARRAFAEAFPNSPRLRLLAWRRPAPLPAAWLSDVSEHVEASEVLLRVLSRYREMSAEELCEVLDRVLLAGFLTSPHCAPIVLASELIDEIVGACLDAGRRACAPQKLLVLSEDGYTVQAVSAESNGVGCNGSTSERRCPRHWEGEQLLWRLESLGIRLFEASFVSQCGFLPHAWPESIGTAAECGVGAVTEAGDHEGELAGASVQVDDGPCQLEPAVVKVTGACLWDEGLLRIELLHPIMDAGCAAPHKPILLFGQRVIMRHLWRTYQGLYSEVQPLSELWELARWPLCEDAGLVREALEYLKGTYRELQAEGGAWRPEHEEALFRMFAALDMQRLPSQALLSPWVPPEPQAVRLLVQQQPAEQFHAELWQEVATGAESLKSISARCTELSGKLNAIEQRTVINKSQINDTILVIEEHQRKKSQAAQASRRVTSLAR